MASKQVKPRMAPKTARKSNHNENPEAAELDLFAKEMEYLMTVDQPMHKTILDNTNTSNIVQNAT